MSRVVRFHETGGPEVLKIEDETVPPPAGDEVQIEVRALGLNRAESMFRSGQYLEQPEFPARLGYEAAGTVVSVGSSVKDFKVGEAVSVVPAFLMNEYGVYGELVNVPAHAVARYPETLTWEQAAAVWMQYTTAYGALIDIAGLQAADTVLIPAASSSVGLAAIQICNRIGATPVALTRKAAKGESLKEAGAAHVIVTEEQDIAEEAMRITDNKGARVVFDPVGGPTVARLTAAMSEHGILFQYGALSPEPTPLPLMDVLGKSLTIRGYLLFEISQDPKRLAKAKEFIVAGLRDKSLQPRIARTFRLDEIVEAHRYLESNQQIGKVVVSV